MWPLLLLAAVAVASSGPGVTVGTFRWTGKFAGGTFRWVRNRTGMQDAGRALRAGTHPAGGVWVDTGAIGLGTQLLVKSNPVGAWCYRVGNMTRRLALMAYGGNRFQYNKRAWKLCAGAGYDPAYRARYGYLKTLIGPRADLKAGWEALKAAGKAVAAGLTGMAGPAIKQSVEAIESLSDDRAVAAGQVVRRVADGYAQAILDAPQNAHLIRPDGTLDLRPRWIDPAVIAEQRDQGAAGLVLQPMRLESGHHMPIVWIPNLP